jgi:hypothetical protein
MSRKVFTAGEVLAAADVNSFLMDQTVMSFAGTAARGSAIPSPVEGMTTFREDTDRIESYTGSLWTSPSDLILIKSQTIGSAVVTVTVSDVFSATYDAYKIIISGGVASTTVGLKLKLGAAANGHSAALLFANYAGGSPSNAATSNDSSFANVGNADTSIMFANIDLFNPFLAQPTFLSSVYADAGSGGLQAGRHSGNTSFTAFTITPSSGNLTGGTINVYGYRKVV